MTLGVTNVDEGFAAYFAQETTPFIFHFATPDGLADLAAQGLAGGIDFARARTLNDDPALVGLEWCRGLAVGKGGELPIGLRDPRFRAAKEAIARLTTSLLPTGRHAVALCGATLTTINPTYTAREVRLQLIDARAAAPAKGKKKAAPKKKAPAKKAAAKK